MNPPHGFAAGLASSPGGLLPPDPRRLFFPCYASSGGLRLPRSTRCLCAPRGAPASPISGDPGRALPARCARIAAGTESNMLAAGKPAGNRVRVRVQPVEQLLSITYEL